MHKVTRFEHVRGILQVRSQIPAYSIRFCQTYDHSYVIFILLMFRLCNDEINFGAPARIDSEG